MNSIEEVIIAVDEPHNQYCRLGVCSMQSVIANVTRLRPCNLTSTAVLHRCFAHVVSICLFLLFSGDISLSTSDIPLQSAVPLPFWAAIA
jgi:hypothetical protein